MQGRCESLHGGGPRKKGNQGQLAFVIRGRWTHICSQKTTKLYLFWIGRTCMKTVDGFTNVGMDAIAIRCRYDNIQSSIVANNVGNNE